MVSTSQAEAANGPTHATESRVAQRELTYASSPRYFVSFLISFRSFRFLQPIIHWIPDDVSTYVNNYDLLT